MKNLKNKNAITLIALIITIIVLLLLTGITIGMLIEDSGMLKNTELAEIETRGANVQEVKDMWFAEIHMAETTGGTAKSMDEILQELLDQEMLTQEEVDTIKTSENNEITIGSRTISFNTDYMPEEILPEDEVVVADGTWDTTKKVNIPKIESTGLIPIYFDASNNVVELTKEDSAEEWNKWYNYEKNEWANAVTKDKNGNITGYFVWIPRYAYKIASNLGTSTEGTIEVKFLQGTTNKDEEGIEISTTYPTVTNNAMTDYVVHPSFTDGTANRWQNGEWDDEIEGFWVAKYEAGFQANTTDINGTVINGTDTVVYSATNKYTSYVSSIITNALGQTLTSSGYSSQYLSYPVFKPLTYSYNVISTGDSYTLSRDIQNATDFYGLANVDSHMMKNSEWGAVAYLTQSKYGRNGTEVTMNSKNLNNLNSKNVYAVTGYAGNTALGTEASSTGNMTGVFDLSGGTYENTASYITNKNSNLTTYGASYAYDDAAETNPETRSTKYATAYPYINDLDSENKKNFKNNFSGKRYGDAIIETSQETGYSWFRDIYRYPASGNSFFGRGGPFNFNPASLSGVFAYDYSGGYPVGNSGFRVILIAQ